MHKKQRLTSSDVGRFLCVRNFYEYCRHAVAMGRIRCCCRHYAGYRPVVAGASWGTCHDHETGCSLVAGLGDAVVTANAAFWWYLVQTEGRAVADPQALAFLTGYLIEKSLAVDNVFVWLMLFSYFSVPAALQRRVLVYGVLGAIVLRTIMIFTGSWLISQFDWILYIYGAFLLFTGVKMALAHEDESGIGDKPLVRWLRGRLRSGPDTIDNEHFFVRKNGLLYATPLMLVLILVELSDVIFAVDSIPAIFAVTTDPFIVLTSNLFAILGLRAMYFLLAGVAEASRCSNMAWR